LVGQLYGPNIFKLLVTRILGLAQTAAFGFAQSITDMLRNYLPAHLLAGWLRPLMISRYLARKKLSDLTDIVNLVLKLNLLGIIPLLVFFMVRGDAFGAWATGGRYLHVGDLLWLLAVMVCLQTIHLLFAMITITVEQASANLAATCIAATSLPFSLILIQTFGTEGAAWGLLSGEIIWLLSAGWLLSRRGFHIAWDITGTLRIALAGIVAGMALWFSGFDQPLTGDMAYSVAITATVFLVCSIFLKPLREAERLLIGSLIPARFILW
ncbi:MAG: polysaccharide biosynthesis C-terminal domain-containing protein, partial [Gallionellaceae bacterium]|nr:polysaccharide biosynthesis C-terminal domain-containing protein [Gallionellaceae bacterium]